MHPFTWQVGFVVVVLIFLILGLAKEWFRPTIIFLICVVAFHIVGILKPREVLDGFANEQIAVVIMLVILADVIQRTRLLDAAFYYLFMGQKKFKSFLGRMMAFVGLTSALLNNTPIVAILIPYVSEWCKRNNIAPSKLLIPLSYITIIGGMMTLIGTSTNLIASGILVENKQEPLGFFDFTPIGIPAFIAGWMYFYFLGHRFLPNRTPPTTVFREQVKDYLTEYRLHPQSPLVGKTVQESGLRHLEDIFLVEILRDNKRITAPERDEVLLAHDRLIFVGQIKGIARLMETMQGLEPYALETQAFNGAMKLRECIIPHNSNLIGKKVNETNFRALYDAAIVGIHRNGIRLPGSIGETELERGDLLLVLAGTDFETLTTENSDLYVMPGVREIRQVDKRKLIFIVGCSLLAIIVGAAGFIPLFQALLITFCLLIVLKVITVRELRKGLDLDLLAILAFSLATGKAIANSGAAAYFAHHMITLFSPLGIFGIMAGFFIVTNFLTNFMANAASVAITIPIAIATAASLGDPTLVKPFVLAIAFAGSAAFITPIGYQTNMMIYGPAGYKFYDYLRAGWLITLLYMTVVLIAIAFFYNLADF